MGISWKWKWMERSWIIRARWYYLWTDIKRSTGDTKVQTEERCWTFE